MKKRTRPHPDHADIVAGQQLMRFCQIEGLSRAALAREMGVQRQSIEPFQSAKVRLPWSAVLRAWQRRSLSPAWLATGEGVHLLPFEPYRPHIPRFAAGARFTDVFPRIAPLLEVAARELMPLHIEQIERFLDAARQGLAPIGVVALVAQSIHEHAPTGEAIRISAPSTPNSKKPNSKS